MESEGVSASGVENNGGFYRSVMKKGRYTTPWPSIPFPSFGELFKFLFCTKDNSKIPSQEMLDQTLPIMRPDFQQCAPGQGLRVTWLGHATVLVQMDGINILTDPIFSNRCAPIQFMGPKRYRRAPCTVADLPKIDLVLISHNHYDHLDYHSVQQLNARFGPELQWCVGMGLGSWMRSMNCENLIELDWWEEKQMAGHENIKIACTPSQHWCKRTATDDNKVLWASWCVLGPTQRFFFAGDTGYCSIFERIGTRYGPFNLAAIPIGAYEPRRFLACQHVDPEEAVQMHQDLKAIKSVAIHWGTFPLSYEYYLEPPQKVKEALEKRGLPEDEFYALNHGESRHQSESVTDD